MEQLKEKTLEQLKVIAYNNIVAIRNYQAGLEAVENEIASRPLEVPPPVKTPEEETPLPKK
jgi:hypothetical protein